MKPLRDHIGDVNKLIILLLAVGYIVACSTARLAPPEKLPPAVPVTPIAPDAHAVTSRVEAIRPPLESATQQASTLTPANVESEKPSLMDRLNQSWSATLTAIASARALEGKAVASDRSAAEGYKREVAKDRALDKAAETIGQQNGVIADLREKVKRFAADKALQALSIGLGFCVLLSAAGGFVTYTGQPKLGIGMMIGGGIGIALAILAMTLQHFAYEHETELGYGVIVLALIGLGVGGYVAYRRMHDSTVAAKNIIQTGVVTGAIDMKMLAPIARANETPLLARIVDRTTSREDRAAADVDGPGNGETTAAAISPRVTEGALN